jgi:hypothetical protein
VAARIFVIPTEDADMARAVGRRMIAAYLNVGVYAAFHRWLGRGEALEPMWEAWQAGDRKGPWPPSPTRWSTIWWCTAPTTSAGTHVGRYVANGVDIPVLAVDQIAVPLGLDEGDPAGSAGRRPTRGISALVHGAS